MDGKFSNTALRFFTAIKSEFVYIEGSGQETLFFPLIVPILDRHFPHQTKSCTQSASQQTGASLPDPRGFLFFMTLPARRGQWDTAIACGRPRGATRGHERQMCSLQYFKLQTIQVKPLFFGGRSAARRHCQKICHPQRWVEMRALCQKQSHSVMWRWQTIFGMRTQFFR